MSPRIAICFHLGYNNRFDQFTPYIDNVMFQCPNTDIYITYREDDDPTQLCLKKYPQATIIPATRGCDTGAFLQQIKYILDTHKKYDYIFKIHTKSNNQQFPRWSQDLLENVAGTVEKVRNVLQLFKQNPKIGMIASEKWILNREINFQIFQDTCRRNRILYNGQFVGGTIFWVKFTIIKRTFKHIDIEGEYSLCETGKPNEPSYTHTWERIFGLIVTTRKHIIQGI